MKKFWIRCSAILPLGDNAILIEGDKAVAKRGAVPFVLLADLAELARTNGIETACIQARRTSHGVSLTMFGVPAFLRQRVRNVCAANWR